MWIDIFNLSQLSLTLTVVVETTIIHALSAKGHDDLAHYVDYACRAVVLLLTYPGVTLATLLYGASATTPCDTEAQNRMHAWPYVHALPYAHACNALIGTVD